MPRRATFPLKPKKKRKKPETVKSLEKDLKEIYYPVIKRRDAEDTCISCIKYPEAGRDTQAGHYAKAESCNPIIKWHPSNINKQCYHCNFVLRANQIEYRKRLLVKYGIDVVDLIESNYKRPMPIDFNYRYWLVTTIEAIRGKSDEFILDYMSTELRSMLSSLTKDENKKESKPS